MLIRGTITALCFLSIVFFAYKTQADERFLEGVLFVKVEQGFDADLRDAFFADPLFEHVRNVASPDTISRPFEYSASETLQHVYRFEFSNADLQTLIDSLETLNAVVYAERVPRYTTRHTPDDVHTEQWWPETVDAYDAWAVTTGDSAVTIAIVDNGVLLDHEDLEANIWHNPSPNTTGTSGIYFNDYHGYDVADNNNDPNPPDNIESGSSFNHGTHCAGIASAATNNGLGIASLGYNASVMAVKVTPDDSDGRVITHAYEGVHYSIDAGADVINMSFGGYGESLTGQSVLEHARNQDIVLVAAAGNSDTSGAFYPAAYEETISVGATNASDEKASYSNFGETLDVMAPGSAIFSTLAETSDSYGALSGTSMAAPMVSGLAALIRADNPEMTAETVRETIKSGCEPIEGQNDEYEGMLGAGRINAANSLVNSGIAGEQELNPLEIAPNPAGNEVSLAFPQAHDQPVTYRILRMDGTVHLSKQTSRADNRQTVDISDFPNGIYLVQAISKGASHTQKLIIR